MKSIRVDPIDDEALLLSVRERGSLNIEVAANRDLILAQYKIYRTTVRKPVKDEPQITPELKNSLFGKYKEGRQKEGAFKFIEDRAVRVNVRSCPYCGRSGLGGTADHYLPKEHFAWFSVYSWNLVPSCNQCQGVKGTRYGTARSGRPIHPLLDTVGKAQLLSIRPRFCGADLQATTFEFGSLATFGFNRKQRKREKRRFEHHVKFFGSDRTEVVDACKAALTDLRIKLEEAQTRGQPLMSCLRAELSKALAYENHASNGPIFIALARRLCVDPSALNDLMATHLPIKAVTNRKGQAFLRKR